VCHETIDNALLLASSVMALLSNSANTVCPAIERGVGNGRISAAKEGV